MKNDHFLVFLAVQVHFPKFLEKVKEWFMLKLHEMTRLLHIVVCSIVLLFLLFLIKIGREECH